MTKTKTKTASTKKSPSLRTLCRQFLAALKPTANAPLSPEEFKKLHDLVEQATKSNHDLIGCGEFVNKIRCALSAAEADLITSRTDNQKLHAEIAPLLNRLPTV